VIEYKVSGYKFVQYFKQTKRKEKKRSKAYFNFRINDSNSIPSSFFVCVCVSPLRIPELKEPLVFGEVYSKMGERVCVCDL
jgi:hypothetical protein